MRKFFACSRIRNTAAFLAAMIVGMLLMPPTGAAKVVKVEIKSRKVVSVSPDHIRSGPYEVIDGNLYLEVDPNDPVNQLIVDLKLAKRNAGGMVEFSTEFELHKPLDADRGNHRLLYFVNNRGSKLGPGYFNFGAGRNWLYSEGYSYLWCGWNCDVPQADDALNINVPIATERGKAITGKIYSEMISYASTIVYSQPIVWGGSIAYPPLHMDKSDAMLTMRRYRDEKPIAIPRKEWEFARWENGAILMYPVAQLSTPDGTVLEGRGVIPNIEVGQKRGMLLKGVDAQLESAVRYIRKDMQRQDQDLR